MTTAMMVGEPVPMQPIPRMFMAQSLSNILERMDDSQLEKFSRFADPVVLIGCGVLYAAQVLAVMQEKRAENVQHAKQEGSDQPADDRGADRDGGGR
jgi:hypothetical protein